MPDMERERDLVLNPNEYAYVLDKTKGLISCVVGSYKMSLSTSDSLVVFDERTKRFREAGFADAIQTFMSAPENWYIVLKNPAKEDKHPNAGSANTLPELQIGKKVNIPGNVSFALYPGQMAKAVQGHRLHSNQYLLARVYDADVLGQEEVEVEKDVEGEDGKISKVKERVTRNKYAVGQLLVIKGTEVPFYIPPTGIEVIPKGGKGSDYVRDAVTLERLEYCILKDEEGNKKYIHGAAVVFPEPDETFVTNPDDGSYKFRAIELSEISGIYLKVIADYKENGKEFKTGDELFITGKEQMIYYPRPEHAIIDYEGKIVHHAVAIPVGEGRYVLDRKTGNIKMIKGPAMYLPDPRNEVIVKRKLTKKQCELWYPGNAEVLKYNMGINDTDPQAVEDEYRMRGIDVLYKAAGLDSLDYGELDNGFMGQKRVTTERGGISRGNTYSKPRMITIDNRFDGVVSVDIWTGYAINVVSKDGKRKVVVGPQTYLLEYDETFEVLELSTGKPKTTDHLLQTVYLRVDNNKISDIIKVQTKDFVDVDVKVSYCVDFLEDYKDKWFSVENYVKYMTDRERSLVKREAKKYLIQDFLDNVSDIISRVVLDMKDTKEESKKQREGRLFLENGMLVHDVEVLSVHIQDEAVKEIIDDNQLNIVRQAVDLASEESNLEVQKELTKISKAKEDLKNERTLYALTLEAKSNKDRLAKQEEYNRLKEAADKKASEAEKELIKLKDEIHKAKLARQKAEEDQELAYKEANDKLEAERQRVYTDALKKVIDSIQPELIAAMTSSANAQMIESVTKSMSPYAIANGESVSDTTNKLLRGTSLEGIIGKMIKNVESVADNNED